MAGYSKRTLVQKLGVRAGDRVALLGVPASLQRALAADQLPPGVRIARRARGERDFVLLFVQRHRDLMRRLPTALRTLDPDGMLWIAWPKKTSGLPSDLSFEALQRAGLAAGVVDVKVCAVDEQYSGLKFMVRKAERAALRARRASSRARRAALAVPRSSGMKAPTTGVERGRHE